MKIPKQFPRKKKLGYLNSPNDRIIIRDKEGVILEGTRGALHKLHKSLCGKVSILKSFKDNPEIRDELFESYGKGFGVYDICLEYYKTFKNQLLNK